MTIRELIERKRRLKKRIEVLNVYINACKVNIESSIECEINSLNNEIYTVDKELLCRSKAISDANALQAFVSVYVKDICQVSVASEMGYSERWLRKLLSKAVKQAEKT